MKLSEQDKCFLIKLARQHIADHLMPEHPDSHGVPEIPDSLLINCGAFVSLYVDCKLRGCIGTFSEEDPLCSNVRNMALSASTSDSRFDSITPEELPRLLIEISVLTPRMKIDGPGKIILGTHGIFIRKGMNRGTLLPQVAVKQQWNVEQFLGNCSQYKAGLGWDGWKTAELYTYEAIVFDSKGTPADC